MNKKKPKFKSLMVDIDWIEYVRKKIHIFNKVISSARYCLLFKCKENWMKKIMTKEWKRKKTENQTAKKNNNNSTMSQDTRDPRHTHTDFVAIVWSQNSINWCDKHRLCNKWIDIYKLIFIIISIIFHFWL